MTSDFSGYFLCRYTFQGKEFINDNIGGNSLNWYDFNARYLDNSNRFTTQDPLQELRPWESSYSAFGNNPKNVDPDGRYYFSYIKGTTTPIINVTDYRWANKTQNLSALPSYMGVPFEMNLWAQRRKDPSFNASATDYVGVGFQVASAGSLSTVFKSVTGLGRGLLYANREVTSSLISALSSPATRQIEIEYMAIQNLAAAGFGNVYEDAKGNRPVSAFVFNQSYIQQVESEILSNDRITSRKNFNLQTEVQDRLRSVMDDEINRVRHLLFEEF